MDKERIIKLLEEIKDLVNDLQNIIDIPIEIFLSDIRNRYSVRHLIVEIVEVASNIGLIILWEKFDICEVMGYSDIFRRLSKYAVLEESTGKDMERLAKLRNLIIHRYWEIDDARIYIEVKDKGVNIIKNFMVEVEKYVSRRWKKGEIYFFTLSKNERNRIIEKILDFLKKHRNIIFIVFYGSFVTDSSFRDIDIGIYLIGEHDFLEYKFMMEEKIRDIVGYPIDIKILNHAPPWFVKRILEKDILYYEKIEGLLFKIYKKALDELYLIGLFRESSAN